MCINFAIPLQMLRVKERKHNPVEVDIIQSVVGIMNLEAKKVVQPGWLQLGMIVLIVV